MNGTLDIDAGIWPASPLQVLLDTALRAHVIRIRPNAPLPPSLRAVASDALNVTGATRHARRRRAHAEMRAHLQRLLKRRVSRRARQAVQSHRAARAAAAQAAAGCEHVIYVRTGDDAAAEAAEGSGEPARDGGAAETAAEARERCVSASELEEMASSEVEWAWRHGFRRVVPGRATPLQEAIRPLAAVDELMLAFEVRWPRVEAEWPPDEPGVCAAE